MKPVSLITGASAGIGTELARVFAAHGHELVVVARRADRLNALADDIAKTGVKSGQPRPTVLASDLEQRDAVAKIAAELSSRGLEPSFVVNNAGFGLMGEAATLDRNEQLGMVDLNVRVLTELSLAFVDSLARHQGGLLNVASIAAFLPGPGMAVYYASKAYVLSFTEALHQEWSGRGIRVTALCPGPVPTEFQARANMELPSAAKMIELPPDRVAQIAYDGLMRGERVVIPGLGNKLAVAAMRLTPHALLLRAVDQRTKA
jgi:short-subunit dehydrogenase